MCVLCLCERGELERVVCVIGLCDMDKKIYHDFLIFFSISI